MVVRQRLTLASNFFSLLIIERRPNTSNSSCTLSESKSTNHVCRKSLPVLVNASTKPGNATLSPVVFLKSRSVLTVCTLATELADDKRGLQQRVQGRRRIVSRAR